MLVLRVAVLVLRGCESTKCDQRHGCNADAYVAKSHVDSSWAIGRRRF
jgi:hypothetical protein